VDLARGRARTIKGSGNSASPRRDRGRETDERDVDNAQEPKEPPTPGYEYNWENLGKLLTYTLLLWAFCGGFFASLLSISTEMRHYSYRHLPPRYLGNFAYYNNDAEKIVPTTSPKLMPWVKAIMCNGNSNDLTCVPTGTPVVKNPLGYPESASCGNVCTNS
jgi:hypothetical protein